MPSRIEANNMFKGDAIDALAAFVELEATIRLIEVATLRGQLEKAEELRKQSHELLDVHMDAKQNASNLLRHKLDHG